MFNLIVWLTFLNVLGIGFALYQITKFAEVLCEDRKNIEILNNQHALSIQLFRVLNNEIEGLSNETVGE